MATKALGATSTPRGVYGDPRRFSADIKLGVEAVLQRTTAAIKAAVRGFQAVLNPAMTKRPVQVVRLNGGRDGGAGLIGG